MFCALQGYGQTNDNDWLLKEYTKLQNENKRLMKDSTNLQNENKRLIKDSTNLQNEINSSVSKIDSLKKVIEDLNKEYSKNAGKKERLEKKIDELEKSPLKTENSKLKVEISNLENASLKKDSTYSKEKLTYENSINVLSEELKTQKQGMQIIRNQLMDFYNKPFEELVGITSLNTIQRDLKILENEPIQKKLKSIQIYHESKLALSEKYNEIRVKEILDQLNSLEKNEANKKLIEHLVSYKYRNQFLQEALAEIIKVDLEEGERENNKLIRPIKFEKVISPLTAYFDAYKTNFFEYPYLNDIIVEIIQKKENNVDADLNYLLQRF
jgi:DNA repair exonuclease SbcCD ATPase subunit